LFGPFLVVFFDNGWKLKQLTSYPALTKKQSLQVQLHSHSLKSSSHHEFSVENSNRNVTGLIQRVFFHVGCRRQIRGKVLFHGSGGFAPETGESAMAPCEIFFPNSKGILQESAKHVFLKGNTGLFGIFFGIIFWENLCFFKQVFLLVKW